MRPSLRIALAVAAARLRGVRGRRTALGRFPAAVAKDCDRGDRILTGGNHGSGGESGAAGGAEEGGGGGNGVRASSSWVAGVTDVGWALHAIDVESEGGVLRDDSFIFDAE